MQLLSLEDSSILGDPLDRFGQVVDRRPGIQARVARAASDPIAAIFEFIIWERLTMHAYVMPKKAKETDAQPKASTGQ